MMSFDPRCLARSGSWWTSWKSVRRDRAGDDDRRREGNVEGRELVTDANLVERGHRGPPVASDRPTSPRWALAEPSSLAIWMAQRK